MLRGRPSGVWIKEEPEEQQQEPYVKHSHAQLFLFYLSFSSVTSHFFFLPPRLRSIALCASFICENILKGGKRLNWEDEAVVEATGCLVELLPLITRRRPLRGERRKRANGSLGSRPPGSILKASEWVGGAEPHFRPLIPTDAAECRCSRLWKWAASQPLFFTDGGPISPSSLYNFVLV